MADSKTAAISNPHPRLVEAGGLEWLPGATLQVDGATLRNTRWIAWALSVGALVGDKSEILATAVGGLAAAEAKAFAQSEIGALLGKIP